MKPFINTKKSLLAVLVLGAISTLAQAEDSAVTIYGILDAGVISVSNQPTVSKSTGNVLAFNTSGDSPSIFGLKGSEDLGGGMKAGFNLEGHMFVSTGAGNQLGGLFGRQSNVTLSNSYGTLALGKQYSPAVLAYAATDPRGLKETFSGLISWALTQNPINGGTSTGPGTTAPNGNSTSVVDVFVANAISINTKFSDVSLTASYSLGGVSGNTSANSVVSLGAVYTGPVTLSASYQADRGQPSAANLSATGVETKKYSVGAGYNIGDATVSANYMDNTNRNPSTGAELAEYQVYGLGVNYRTAANNVATLAYYSSKNKDMSNDTSKTWILSDDYSLSKRTTLYALVAGVNAGANYSSGAAFGVANDHAYLATAGKTTSAVEIGLRQTF